MRFPIWEDQRMVAFFAQQYALHPEGVLPIHWAARLCSTSRETMLLAIARGKMRVATYGTRPIMRVIPFVDICQWQATRFDRPRVRDWVQLNRDALRLEQRNLERIGDVIVCTGCGRSDVITNIANKTMAAT